MNDFYNVEYLSERVAALAKERDELKKLLKDRVEVVHGRWIECIWRPKCSICGFSGSLYDTPTQPFKYCPNCGARMDGDA